jgi:hypothetical protein
MNPHITVITLGVDNLERSVAFYRDGLGFSTQGIIAPSSSTELLLSSICKRV